MKKITQRWVLFLACLLFSGMVGAKTLYLNPGVWETGGAKYAVWHWQTGNAGAWTGFMAKEDGADYYSVEIADASDNVIFGRFSSTVTAADWSLTSADGFWNKTGDLAMGTDNLYTISGWGSDVATGSWSTYSPSAPDPEPEESYVVPTGYVVAGTFNTWKPTTAMTENEGVYEQAITLNAGKEYQFKIRNGENYWGNAGTMTQANCTEWPVSTSVSSNITLITTTGGDYTFRLTIAGEEYKLSVIYPEGGSSYTMYQTAVRSQCEDVMIQAYYWTHGKDAQGHDDSSELNLGYGDMKWTSLNAQAADIAGNFDLVWLAPSQATADWTGFLPVNYSDQNNRAWGSSTELKTLIGNLHAGGAKVVADIVLNHCNASRNRDEGWEGAPTTFCDFETFDFGKFGSFDPDWSWITKYDEMYLPYGDSNLGSAVIDRGRDDNADCGGAHYDDASLLEDEYNYSKYNNGSYETATWSRSENDFSISRDWAHKKQEVREMSRAYLTWMRDEMGYDGFRYDFMKGFHCSHINDYNRAAAPYFSVMEVFESNINIIKGLIYDAGGNTSIFDFPTKFQIKSAVGGYNLPMLKSQHDHMLLADPAYRKNAVVFCENHDSFREDYNLAGTPDATLATLQTQTRIILQANAFILAMPGIPCVFYPHWKAFPEQIDAMIHARKMAGVHSESEYQDWAGAGGSGNNWYTARTTGKKGYLQVKLGVDCNPQAAPDAAPDGLAWRCAYADENVGVYYTSTDAEPEPEPEPEPVVTMDTVYYIAGTFTEWATGMQEMPYSLEDVTEGSSISYKVVCDYNTYTDGELTNTNRVWLGQPYTNSMTRSSNAWKLDGGNNVSLTADANGTYTFSYDPVTEVLTVTFPVPDTLTLVAQSGEEYYATYSNTVPVQFMDEATKVYTLALDGSDNSKIVMNEVASKKVPAATGVLLKSSSDKASYVTIETADALSDNLLKPGTGETTTGENCKFYRLAYYDYTAKTGLGFYYGPGCTDGKAFVCKVGSAYLAVPTTAAPERFLITEAVEGTPIVTAILSASVDESVKKVMIDGRICIIRGERVYDITGRQVQ